MGEVIPFGRQVPPALNLPPWQLVMIERQGTRFAVRVTAGSIEDPVGNILVVGVRDTLLEAIELARVKARILGVNEILDCTGVPPVDPEAA